MSVVAREIVQAEQSQGLSSVAPAAWTLDGGGAGGLDTLSERAAHREAAYADGEVVRYPLWARVALLVGGSALCWAGIIWVATRLLRQ